MEESAKRKERLKAMRVEANQVEASLNLESSPIPTHLSNPFNEPAPLEASPASARFDFYTDPMAAFSGQKRKIQNIHQSSPTYISPSTNPASPLSHPPQPSSFLPGPGNFDMSPTSNNQFQNSCSPGQKMYEASPPYQGSDPWRSPIRMGNPFPENQGAWNNSFRGPQGSPAGGWNGSVQGPQGTPARGWNGPVQGPQGTPGVWTGSYPSNQLTPPGVRSNLFPGHQGTPPGVRSNLFPGHQGTTPGVGNAPFLSHQGTPPDVGNAPFLSHQGTPPDVGNAPFPSHQGTPPGVRSGPFMGHQGTGAYNRPDGTPVRGYSSNSSRGSEFSSSRVGRGVSPFHSSGRGSGHQNSSNASSGSGRGGGRGRGRGNHGSVSARERPDMFYNRSMVEDPWKSLEPVVRTLSWFPKSIREKNASDSKPSKLSIGFSSGTSLSHLLAAAMEDATGDGKEL